MALGIQDRNSELYVKVSSFFISKFNKCSLSPVETFFIQVDYNDKGGLEIVQPGVAYYHSKINKSNKDVMLLLEFSAV